MRTALLAIATLLAVTVTAQERDSIVNKTQYEQAMAKAGNYSERNFSDLRTLNIIYNLAPDFDNTVTKRGSGQTIEKARLRHNRFCKINATLPAFHKGRTTVFATGEFTVNELTASRHSIFANERKHLTWRGGLSLFHTTMLRHKPLIISANASVSGWQHGYEQMHVFGLAHWMVHTSASNSVGVGLIAIFPFRGTPVFPMVSYTHRYTRHLMLDISGRGAYMRHTTATRRLSLGTGIDMNSCYLRLKDENRTLEYRQAMVQYEGIYEQIIHKHFFLYARAGIAQTFQNGLYDPSKISRRPIYRCSCPTYPYINIGISYNLFTGGRK